MAAEHYAIDLARTRPRAAAWSWVLLAFGLAAAGWVGFTLQHARAEQSTNEQSLARLESALADRVAVSGAAAARAPTPAERRAQTELARLAADLYRPWLPLLDALEGSAVSPVRLQQLSVDSAFTKLQLQVDAPDLPDVLRYVHALDTAGAPLQGAQLLSHEWLTPSGSARRLQARINVGLVAAPVPVTAATAVAASNVCGRTAATPCLTAKAAP